MILNGFLNTLTIFNLGQRFLRTLPVDRKAIRRNKLEYYTQAWEDVAAQGFQQVRD